MRKRNAMATAMAVATIGGLVLATGPAALAADELEITIVGSSGEGSAEGFLAPGVRASGITVAPSPTVPYPASDPLGWEPQTGNAMLFRAETNTGREDLFLYCAQILIGRGDDYTSVSRGSAGIANSGYVARVVAGNFPATDAPTALSGRNLKTAAVQAAIWYLTDGYVVAEADPLHDVVAQIVDDALAAGELPEEEPDLTFELTGPGGPFDTGEIAGPFVTGAAAGASTTFTVDAGAATVFADAAGTAIVPPGTPLAVGTPFWVRSDVPTTVSVVANGSTAVAGGLFFMGADFGFGTPQTMLSASLTDYAVLASASLEFQGEPVPPAAPPRLPETGAETGAGAVVAIVLLLLGAGAVVAVSRMRRRSA